MKNIQHLLGTRGLHVLLLPLFFTLHNYIQYAGLVPSSTAWGVLFEVLVITILVYLVLLLFTKDRQRASILTTHLLIIVLFYGVLKDFLQLTLKQNWLGRYIILLPLLLLVLFFDTKQILRKQVFYRANLFLNILFIVFILLDLVPLIKLKMNGTDKRNLFVKSTPFDNLSFNAGAGRPDVYFLLFDCYPSSSFLHDYMHYDNSRHDSMLTALGFHLFPASRSNYTQTAFSLASEMNAAYLQGIAAYHSPNPWDFNIAMNTVKNAAVFKSFEKLGYQITNLSIFDIDRQPALHRENFLSTTPNIVMIHNTLPRRIFEDLLWRVRESNTGAKIYHWFFDHETNGVLDDAQRQSTQNKDAVDSLYRVTGNSSPEPKFVYAHFYLPHRPFFYKEDGTPNKRDSIFNPKTALDRSLFLGYVGYTNRVMEDMLNKILQQSRRQPIIIVQSDHSANDYETCPPIPDLNFRNYTAFYYPDRDYHLLTDSISAINVFPVIFNKYFHTSIPMQKSASFFLSF